MLSYVFFPPPYIFFDILISINHTKNVQLSIYMYIIDCCTIIIVYWALSDEKKLTIKHRYTYPYKIMVLTPTNKTLCVASLVIIDSYVHTNLHSYIIDQTCNHRLPPLWSRRETAKILENVPPPSPQMILRGYKYLFHTLI